MPRLASLVACLLLALCAGCSDSAKFTTRYASDFVHTPHTISVLGVYKDGRMNPDVWDQISGLCAPFGGSCGPAYDTLISSNPNLSAAIDDYARANGIGDDLIDQLAPAATGDLIMVVTVSGKVAGKNGSLPDSSAVAGGPPSSIGSKYNRGASTGMTSPTGGATGGMRRPRQIVDGAQFEMSASLFSVKQHRSVGLVAMEYSGQSVDDAVQRLAARLGVEIPGAKCGGWNWGVQVDDQHIRELIEH